MLDDHCLRCGLDGYWHEDHRHDAIHPSGKTIVRLECPASPAPSEDVVVTFDRLEAEALCGQGRRTGEWYRTQNRGLTKLRAALAEHHDQGES
jgi:hypothetical protein